VFPQELALDLSESWNGVGRGGDGSVEEEEALVAVADVCDVGAVEDRGGRVGVDGQDGARTAGADEVVELAGHADGDIQPGAEGVAGEADLATAGQPASVGDLAGAHELGAEQGTQFVELAVLVRGDAGADGDEASGSG